MKTLLKIIAILSLALAGSIGFSNTSFAQNNPEGSAYANVVLCADADCTETAGGMEGAVVTSFNAAGVEIDSCSVETFPSGMDGCVVAQHAGDGWYVVSNLLPGYTLLGDTPEVLESESHGTQLNWYAIPAEYDDEIPADTIRTNVIACVDPACENLVDIVDMIGATVSSFDAEGTLVDSCTVSLTASDSVVCDVVSAPAGGWYEVTQSAEYAEYVLLSNDPTVFESEMHGAVYVWYFAPAEQPADDDAGPITSLPETGSGIDANIGYLAAAAIGIVLMAVGGSSARCFGCRLR